MGRSGMRWLPDPGERIEAPGEGSRAEIETWLRTVVDGVIAAPLHRGDSVLVEGPPGIGKSHLCRAVVAAARAGGSWVLSARAEERHRRVSFAVIHELVGPSEAADPAEIALERVDARCALGPVVCWVDDAHQADAASLRVLRRLVWAARDLPLMMLISARSYPRSEGVELLTGQVRCRVTLPAMDTVMVGGLVRRLTGRAPGPRLSAHLQGSGGNPLFATEMVNALEAGGLLDRAGAGTIELVGDPPPNTDGLAALVRGHLSQLDESVTELLGAMTVLGSGASLEDLGAMSYLSSASRWTAADRAVRSGLAVWSDVKSLDFSHELYREAAYAQLEEVDRVALHRRAAELLRDRGAPAAVVAEHLARSADDRVRGGAGQAELARALRSAAEESSAHAPAVTADLLGDLQIVVDGSEAGYDRLTVERATALQRSGQHQAAERLAEAQLAVSQDPQCRQELHELRIRSQLDRGETSAALDSIDRLLAGRLPPAAARQLRALRCWVTAMAGQWREAEQTATALLGESAAEERRQIESSVLTLLSCAAHLRGRSDQASVLIERQLQLLAGDDSGVRARRSALVWPPVFELAARGVGPAAEAVTRCREASADVGARWLDPYHCFVSASVAILAGEWDDASAELDAGLEMTEEIGSGWISTAIGQRAYLEAHRGRLTDARQRLRLFEERTLPLQFGADDPGWAELAVLEVTPALPEAVSLAHRLWAAAEEISPAWMLSLAPDVARVALTGGDLGLCERMASRLAGLDVSGCPAVAPVVDQLVGMCRADAELLTAAARAFEGYGVHLLATYAWEEAACVAASTSRPDLAREPLERAVSGYQHMGAIPDRDRVLGRVRRLGLRRGPRSKHRTVDFGPDSLTATELRVARLVRAGRTNPQIASQLWLSPRTVQTHVSHILAKLGLRSRADLTGVNLPD